MVSKQSWFAGHAVQMPSTSRGSAVLSLVRRRFIGMVKVSFSMLFDCVALSSKHMLQVRCSPWGLSRPSPFAMNTPHTGGLLGRRFKRLRRYRTLTLAPALADAAVAAAAAAAAPRPLPRPRPRRSRCRRRPSPRGRRRRRRRCPARRRRRRPRPSRRRRRRRRPRRRCSSTRPPLRL